MIIRWIFDFLPRVSSWIKSDPRVSRGKYSARIEIENASTGPRIVWVEPWGEDYTLLPKEKLEIIARNDLEPPWFVVTEDELSTVVAIEGITNDYDVLQNGDRIQCGHHRQAALNAGLRMAHDEFRGGGPNSRIESKH